jgi:nucleoside-diphosphate-sugar epimerase
MPNKKIVVTGGSGKAGRAVVRDLVEHGYQVLNIDLAPAKEPLAPFVRVDLTDLGQTYEALQNAEAVIHLAAIPAPGLFPDELTFRTNVSSTYNVFSVAVALKLERVVWASSETILGLPFDKELPPYVPIDEMQPPLPQSSYALSKLVSEALAQQFNRQSGIPFIGLRFSNIMEPDDYKRFPDYWNDSQARKWNFWGYVDARDVAQSCRLALAAPVKSAEVFIIAAADTVMTRPNHELMAEVYPNVPLQANTGDFETLLSISRARQILGYAPQFSWRDHISTTGSA